MKSLTQKKHLRSKIYIQVISKLGKRIRTTKKYWKIIVNIKHPAVKDKETNIKKCLEEPDFIRKSKSDKSVYLFYKKQNKHFLCVIVKHLSKKEGFIITVYLTRKMMEGELIWTIKKRKK